MSAAHTPGPWLFRRKSDSVHQPSPSATHPYGEKIFRFDETDAPSDGDLALILSAPELLAVAKKIKAHGTLSASWIEELDAAISKATRVSA